MDGRTEGWRDKRKISPFYRTSSPIGAAALPPPMKSKEKVEQGKGAADHLMPLGYLVLISPQVVTFLWHRRKWRSTSTFQTKAALTLGPKHKEVEEKGEEDKRDEEDVGGGKELEDEEDTEMGVEGRLENHALNMSSLTVCLGMRR